MSYVPKISTIMKVEMLNLVKTFCQQQGDHNEYLRTIQNNEGWSKKISNIVITK